ncbi:MarR family winged helix-turn-helix transcriptional regulator [Gordonia liuliyuniae]|uniref:MarR family winged helix-turn-helix transcriptional regulator n=1 Tax=Gordonia liuliyuniae TaxID=2911517 RepID=A0ABS9IQ96_9ACTN|nr:MarR family winged helix-turn-helix transcriptional regulator [Gordonia liuliyuniae]MCF8587697.1 MarR family winged helix-turn-helix transcriptional regulator [Gordonia liuliyuniae]
MHSESDDPVLSSPLYRGLVDELLRLRRRRNTVDEGAVLDVSAFSILWLFDDGRARTLRDLAAELCLEQSTVNRQVNTAVKHGYIERFEVPGQVSRLYRPTDAGRAAYLHDGLRRARRLEVIFADLAPGTPEGLLKELKAYNDASDRHADDEL